MRKLFCKINLILIAMIVSCLIQSVPCMAAESTPIAALTTQSNGLPYYIMVNRDTNVVTVYTLDSNGYYTVQCKSFICSTGRQGHLTPRGTYNMGTNRYTWRLMKDNSYAQYACGIYKGIMFHSICYTDERNDAMMADEYNALGTKASLGCVRLQTADAKWIYDNCLPGTYVTVIADESDKSVAVKPKKYISNITEAMDNGWDPTDPAKGNPWNAYVKEHPEVIK